MREAAQRLSRRDFLKASAAAVGAVAMAETITPPTGPPVFAASESDLDFATALEAARAIRARDVSSLELTERMLERIEEYDGEINAVVLRFGDDARVQGRQSVGAGRMVGAVSRRADDHERDDRHAGHPHDFRRTGAQGLSTGL